MIIDTKNSSNPKNIFKSAKKCEKVYTKETPSKVATTKFLGKIPKRKKISNEQFNLCEAKIPLDEILKFINSQTNNKSSGNNTLTAEFYKHVSNKLVINSWGKLATCVLLLEQEPYLSYLSYLETNSLT